MKRISIFLIAVFFSILGHTQVFNPIVNNIINEVDQDSLVFFLRNISGEDSVIVNGEKELLLNRYYSNNGLAAEYLAESLEGFGLTVIVQDFFQNGTNIYAVQEGTLYPNEYYMICAHYDSMADYCADDNGSGTAAVLEAARIFTQYEFEYSIIYAFWDEEEIGLVGSEYYAEEAELEGMEIMSVINMDMIAWDGDNDMTAEIHSSNTANSGWLSDYIVEIDNEYDLALDVVIKLPGTTASDHASFWNSGYMAVLVIEEYYGGDFNPYYHTEEDRIAILSMPYFHEMAKLSIGSLASLATPTITTSSDEVSSLSNIILDAYPNPFQNKTTIAYALQVDSYIRISMVNSLGKEVRVLADEIKQTGKHQLHFQAGNLPEGMYFLVLQTPEIAITRKVLIN